jgi:hypothetical protein
VAALTALVCLPGLLALMITADIALDDAGRAVRRRYRRWRTRRVEARVARRAGLDGSTAAAAKPAGPPIEQVAADLRRLGRQRTGVATRSPVWFAAVQRAYDDRLCLACQELEIAEYLRELTGTDLDIERVRVQGMLQAAGLRLESVDAGRRQDSR